MFFCEWLIILMAPALVEHTATQERHSTSKKFIGNLDYLRPFDLINSKVKITSTPDFPEKQLFSPAKNICNNITKCGMSVLNLDSLAGDKIADVKSSCKALSLKELADEKKICTIVSNSDITELNSTSITTKSKTEIETICPEINETNIERLPQPCAKPDSTFQEHIKLRQTTLKSKYSKLNSGINELNSRLRNFQFNNIKSHVACVNQGVKISKNDAATFTNSSTQKLERLFDLAKHLDDITDDESCIEKKNINKKSKKKSENPLPNNVELQNWRQRRLKLGSQCSWLNLKIPTLDKKLQQLNTISSKLHSEKIDSKKENVLEDNGVEQSCSRTMPYNPLFKHRYIHRPVLPTMCIGCHNHSSISLCRLCVGGQQSQVNLQAIQLDHSYHANLSLPGDVLLSNKLEESFRTQQISSKVRLQKPSKKKKKAALPKEPRVPSEKKINHQKVVQKLKQVKSKREQGEDYRRKRQNSEQSFSGRLRKVRKISDTFNYDSSKPPTPNNELNSPLPTPVGKKKKSNSTGAYDINNIVIHSISSSTRLERIQYKEIPTPGWRSIDGTPCGQDQLAEVELTDDEVYEERHNRCENNEQRRFTTVRDNRRLRSSRVSEDYSNPPSPFIDERSALNTPLDSPCSGTTIPQHTLSTVTPVAEDERDCSWPARTYPLGESQYKQLLSENPSDKPIFQFTSLSDSVRLSPRCVSPTPALCLKPSPLVSPSTTTTRNDWTVLDEQLRKVTQDDNRKGIVLKLAKK